MTALAIASQLNAAELCFKQGDNAIGAGLNLDFGQGIGLSVAYDRGAINDMFSFGGELNFSVDNTSYYGHDQHYTYVSPQFRFGFHPFGLPGLQGDVAVADKIDPYVVAHTGPTFWNWKIDTKGSNYSFKTKDDGVHMAYGIAAGI